jgi:hypothetical protein
VLTTRHPSTHKKSALTLPASGGCSVGIVHLRTKARELVLLFEPDRAVSIATGYSLGAEGSDFELQQQEESGLHVEKGRFSLLHNAHRGPFVRR